MLRISYVFAGVVAVSGVARAEPDRRAQALKLFGDSDSAYKTGHFEQAADLLRRAYALYPEPLLLYNLGRALEGLGDAKGAVEQYERYLAEGKDIADRGAIERRIDTLKTQLARADADARRRTDEAKRTQATQAPPPTDADLSVREIAPWATLGSGVALIATGAVFGLLASSNHDDAVKAPRQADAQALQQTAQHDATVANVLFGIGGAIAVGGAVWEIIEWRRAARSDDCTAHLRITPSSIAVEWILR